MYIESRWFAFSAILGVPKGSPLVEVQKHELGGGWGLTLGPFQLDISPPWRPLNETNNPPDVALYVGADSTP